MKVVFLCNRLSRTKLRGSWQALLDASHGAVETDSVVASPDINQEKVKTSKEVGRVVVVLLSTSVRGCCYCQVVSGKLCQVKHITQPCC